MEREVSKIVCRDETDSKEVNSSGTLVLSNPPTPEENLQITHMSLGDRKFSDFNIRDYKKNKEYEVPLDDFDLTVLKDTKVIHKIIDHRGNEFPGTEFEELQVTDSHLIVKDSDEFSEILKISSNGHFPESTLRDFITQVGVTHWIWEKF